VIPVTKYDGLCSGGRRERDEDSSFTFEKKYIIYNHDFKNNIIEVLNGYMHMAAV
jgi:hypothetical protein